MQNPKHASFLKLVATEPFEMPNHLGFSVARAVCHLWRRFQFVVDEGPTFVHEFAIDDCPPDTILVQPGLMQVDVGVFVHL